MRRAWSVFRAAWREERRRPRIRRNRDQLDFLPATVELLERPASPAARWLAVAIPALFAIALLWAWIGKTDTVAVAQGRIVPIGGVQIVQPLEIGVVRAIHVQEGQRVAKGAVLIELDQTESAADHARLAGDLLAVRLDMARLEAMTSEQADSTVSLLIPDGANGATIRAAKAQLAAEIVEHRQELAELDATIARQEAEQNTAQARISSYEAMIPLVRERVDAIAALVAENYEARMTLVELTERLVTEEHGLLVEQGKLAELERSVEVLRSRRAHTVAAYEARIARELSDAIRNEARLAKELAKARQRLRARVLRAPVDGIVQQLAVRTVGGVVRPAEPVISIVPSDASLRVEAMLPNKDIGFVHEGQAVEIKVESFPFTRYGLVPGRVEQISADAVVDEAAGLVFPIRIALEAETILVGDREIRLVPGMAVTAEVRTGQRRLMEFFLSPFVKYRDEALRER